MLAKKRVQWLFVGAVAVVVAAGWGGYRAWKSALHEFYAYSSYANALTEYMENHTEFPPSLEALERAYNAPGPRSGCVPPEPPYKRPSFRIITTFDGDSVF